jgi:hypothetical protein
MSDPALVPGCTAYRGVIRKQKPERTCAHGTSVSGIWGRGSRFGPVHSREQPERRRSGAPPCTYVAAVPEEVGDTKREGGWIPAPLLLKAEQQLAGELSVVGVLAKRMMC